MKLTKSTHYALYAAMEMAMAPDALVTVAQVAQKYGIPEGALAKVLQQLVRSGIALGTRGIGGGYRLARPRSEITVLDVMRVFDAPRRAGQCLLADGPDQTCERTPTCKLGQLFDEVEELSRCTFQSVTLETLVR